MSITQRQKIRGGLECLWRVGSTNSSAFTRLYTLHSQCQQFCSPDLQIHIYQLNKQAKSLSLQPGHRPPAPHSLFPFGSASATELSIALSLNDLGLDALSLVFDSRKRPKRVDGRESGGVGVEEGSVFESFGVGRPVFAQKAQGSIEFLGAQIETLFILSCLPVPLSKLAVVAQFVGLFTHRARHQQLFSQRQLRPCPLLPRTLGACSREGGCEIGGQIVADEVSSGREADGLGEGVLPQEAEKWHLQ